MIFTGIYQGVKFTDVLSLTGKCKLAAHWSLPYWGRPFPISSHCVTETFLPCLLQLMDKKNKVVLTCFPDACEKQQYSNSKLETGMDSTSWHVLFSLLITIRQPTLQNWVIIWTYPPCQQLVWYPAYLLYVLPSWLVSGYSHNFYNKTMAQYQINAIRMNPKESIMVTCNGKGCQVGCMDCSKKSKKKGKGRLCWRWRSSSLDALALASDNTKS